MVQTVLTQQAVFLAELLQVFDGIFIKTILVLRVSQLVIIGRAQRRAIVGCKLQVRQGLFVVLFFVISLPNQLIDFRAIFDCIVLRLWSAIRNYLFVLLFSRIDHGKIIRYSLFVFFRLFAAGKCFGGLIVFTFEKGATAVVVVGRIVPFAAGIFFQIAECRFCATKLFGHKISIAFFKLDFFSNCTRTTWRHIVIGKRLVVFFFIEIVIANF